MKLNDIKLIELRHRLHQQPELSNYEKQTSALLQEIMDHLKPDKIIKNLAGQGFAVVFEFKMPGKTIVFRAELDGLPIAESSDKNYRSSFQDISHTCGHDGHMTILTGLAQKLEQHRKDLSGKVILLFQPAEETADGAHRIISDKRFLDLLPDYIFAFHNLPGFELGEVILKKDTFASTSVGLKIKLLGATSHAGHPENGRSPALALAALINQLTALPQMISSFQQAALITIIQARLGEEAFGTSPGEAQLMATFRAHSDEILNKMKEAAEHIIITTAKANELKTEIDWVEYFPALINDEEAVSIIENAAETGNLKRKYQDKPFAWTEDFAFYTQKFKGAFCGLGAGQDQPQLHNSSYDFPDELIEKGVTLFFNIIKTIQKDS